MPPASIERRSRDTRPQPAWRGSDPAAPSQAAQPDLSAFRCRRCGACCRIPGGLVRLRDGESAALAAALGMDERTFLDEHTLLAPDRRSLVLRDHADGSCEMLGADGLCRVHAAKPAQCRAFPFSWRNSDSFRTCPGLRALAEGDGA